MTPRHGQAYNNALILNNLGCVLLQSGAYRDAFSTFRDAVATFQNSCSSQDDTSRGNGDGKDKIVAALKRFRATERLLWSHDVSVVGLEDDEVQNLVFESAFGESMQVVFTLRPHSGARRDTDIDSAIMLHNFALSHVFMARCGLLQEKEAHNSALYIFRAAFRILFQKFETIFDAEGCVVEDQVPCCDNFCGVVTVVLANLVYTLNHQGFEREARHGFVQLREFLQNFSISCGNSTLFGRVTAAAAA